MFDYIEMLYNPKRRHGSNNQLSLVQFEQQYRLRNATVQKTRVRIELVHLSEPHHTPAFWWRTKRAMPDYERRKKLLLRAADVDAH